MVVAAAGGQASHERIASPTFCAPALAPRAQYTIDCKLDLDQGWFEGTQLVRFKNESPAPIKRLAMAWPPLQHGGKLSVTVGGKSVPTIPDVTGPDGFPLVVFDLPQALPRGKEISIDCQFSLAEDGGGKPDRMNMTDWNPRLWWGFPTADDYAVKLDAPSEYVVGSSGRLNAQTGYYECQGAKTFGLFLARDYRVAEAMAGDVQVRCLYAADMETCARLLLDTAVDVIGFYRSRFSFYPYKSLTIIPGVDQPMGGYPVAAGLVAIHGQQRMSEQPWLHWQWITAHEIGHQYFGEYVLEPNSPGWLWIGLGIYADREYVRARGLGLDKHRSLVARYVEGVGKNLDTTLHRTAEQISKVGFDYNNVAMHGKGFSVISALACVLGPETFGSIYQRCLRDYGGRRLGVDEFQAICEAESQQDLGWFFDQWVRSNRYLQYQVASQSCVKDNDKYVTRVRVECRGTLQMPIPVMASFEDGTSQVQFSDRLLKTDTLEFISSAPLKKIQLDPNEELAMAEPAASSASPDAATMVQALPWTGAGKQALSAFEAAKSGELSDMQLWVKLGMTLYDGGLYPQALEAFRQCERSEPGTSAHFIGIVWQGHILDLMGRREEAIRYYRAALQASDGQSVSHDQYHLLIDRAWVEKRIEEPFRRKP